MEHILRPRSPRMVVVVGQQPLPMESRHMGRCRHLCCSSILNSSFSCLLRRPGCPSPKQQLIKGCPSTALHLKQCCKQIFSHLAPNRLFADITFC